MKLIVLAAVAVVAMLAFMSTRSQGAEFEAGRFQMALNASGGAAWILDTATGRVRICDSVYSREEPGRITCYPWLNPDDRATQPGPFDDLIPRR